MSVNQPEISVVIPVYRVEKYLRECMDSVLAQTHRNFEVILVDDGSPDACPAMCDEYASRYSSDNGHIKVRAIHKENAGLGMARNTGMDAATGRYVFFLDSDDTLRSDAIELLASKIRSEKDVRVIHGRLCRFFKSGEYSHDVRSGELKEVSSPDGMRRVALCSFSSFPGDEPFVFEGSSCAALYDLNFLRTHNIRFVSEREYISEDYIFNYNVAMHADKILQVEDTIYRYRVTPGSLTQTPREDIMERTISFCEHVEQLMLRDGFGRQATLYAFGYACSRLRAQIKYLFLSSLPSSEKMSRLHKWHQMPYFSRMQEQFQPSVMSRLHRLGYNLFIRHRFKLLRFLILLQSYMRKCRGHIGD